MSSSRSEQPSILESVPLLNISENSERTAPNASGTRSSQSSPNPSHSDQSPYDQFAGPIATPGQQRPPSPTESSTDRPKLHETQFGYVALFSPWLPSIDPEYHQAKGFRSWRIWHSKRDILLWTAFATSMVVLLANVILVAVLGSKYGITSRRGLIKLYEGDCNRVKLIGAGSHVCINILSTLLLGASNLCMQLLVAPTRQEVDVAHRKKIWLDIGIPSWKNLGNIKRSRAWMFSILMLSSVPLHFM